MRPCLTALMAVAPSLFNSVTTRQDLVGRFLRGGKEQLRLLPQARACPTVLSLTRADPHVCHGLVTALSRPARHFQSDPDSDSASVAPQTDLDTAVFDGYVSKSNKTAIQDQVEKSLKHVQGLLNSDHRDHINQSTDRKAKESEIEKFLRERAAASGAGAGADDEDEDEDEDGPSVQQARLLRGCSSCASSRRAPHYLSTAGRPARTTALGLVQLDANLAPWRAAHRPRSSLLSRREPTQRLATTAGWAVMAMAPPRLPRPRPRRPPARAAPHRHPRQPRPTALLEGVGAVAVQR